jgi:Tfp pilus assembly protein PilF
LAPPGMATWWNNLGMVLHDLGDLDGASVQLERALEISEATLGPDHPNVAVTRANLAAAAAELDESAEAL